MDTSRLVKWIFIIVLAAVAWKYALPWAKRQIRTSGTSAVTTENSCVVSAQRASEAWGAGLHNFVNPPYDLGAWSSFRGDVETKIAAAESECRASSQSCDEARGAMRDLRILVGELDTAITNGSPVPGDAVQRQEAIDTKIDAAADLVRSGK